MKKTLKIVLFSSMLGVILAGLFFFNIKDKAEAKNKPFLYAFQVGVFKNRENANNYRLKFPLGKVVHDGEYYRVYIGITRNNKELLSDLFDSQNYSYYIKEIETSEEMEREILKYDELLEKSSEENRISILKNMLESFLYDVQN